MFVFFRVLLLFVLFSLLMCVLLDFSSNLFVSRLHRDVSLRSFVLAVTLFYVLVTLAI